jgi:dimethylhistidine N-methyltransferase
MALALENACLSEVLSGFTADVGAGLSKSQKELPAKYLYDEIGSALFEAITVLPEYGLTRAEARLLNQHADEIARWLPSNVSVAELGSGSGRKTRSVLQSIASLRDSVRYTAIDVSQGALDSCCSQLNSLSGVDVRGLQLPYLEGLAEICGRRRGDECLLVLFLGSSIGNFDREQAAHFLSGIRKRLQPGDALLLGADLVKPGPQLVAAYDDPAGVTAAFNLNLLGRINRELNANFDLRSFQHEARWCASERRIEMHLCSTARQTVDIPDAGCQVQFDKGETIWTESSHKFETAELSELAAKTGFISVARWVDNEWPFVESLWIA